ncbi:MAG: acetamidase/formamidase family protein [Betaproteobacteria bacterium]|nr:acetamidase/formamidase family protein [Betaproteobacteria bacterium]
MRSTPETVSWGYIAADLPPVLRIRSGQTVRIDTVSHQGINTKVDPVTYFGAAGIPPEQVLQDAQDIFSKVRRTEGAGNHVITGPVYVEGAQPGDMLEVRVLDVEFRVPYGVNSTGAGWGVLPELLAQPALKTIKLDLERRVALFSAEVEVPLAPFMGIVAVAPPPELVRVSTKPPGAFGGNMDFRHLIAGATLYLGRRRSRRHGDRDLADTDAAAHRAPRRGQSDEVAARGGRCELLRDGNGRQSRCSDEERGAGNNRLSAAESGIVSGRRLRAREPQRRFQGGRSREPRKNGLRRGPEADVPEQRGILAQKVAQAPSPAPSTNAGGAPALQI